MHSVNRLGLKAVLATSIILVAVVAAYTGLRYAFNRVTQPSVKVAQTDASPSPDTLIDSDQDGLPDTFEALYHTDATNPDTDSDGTGDYQEIAAGRDPAVAGSHDESRPPTGADILVQNTYTQRYLASLPDNVPREDILDKDRVEAFVNLNQGQLLPSLAPEAIKTTTASGKEAIATYLHGISFKHNHELQEVTSTDIEQAFAQKLQVNHQPLNDLVAKLAKNVTILQALAAPTEVVKLHTSLVAAGQSLLNNAKLLQNVDKDFMGSLIGAKNIEELGQTFRDISEQVKTLEAKYGLEDVPTTS